MSMNSNIEWMCKFYASLCDGDWEHGYGFFIENIDNPGWKFTFDLSDTAYRNKDFINASEFRTDDDWVIVKKEDYKFVGYGGAFNLDEIIARFREWIETEPTQALRVIKPD